MAESFELPEENVGNVWSKGEMPQTDIVLTCAAGDTLHPEVMGEG